MDISFPSCSFVAFLAVFIRPLVAIRNSKPECLSFHELRWLDSNKGTKSDMGVCPSPTAQGLVRG